MRRTLVIAITALALGGCELINNSLSPTSDFANPAVALQKATLVQAPTATDLALYFCEDVLGALPCLAVYAAVGRGRPEQHQVQFHFEANYQITNNNSFPMLTAEILAALSVYGSQLGAVCAALCSESDVQCTGAPGATTCKDDASDIKTIDDFVGALPDALILTVDAAINGDLKNFVQRELKAGEDSFVRFRFSIGADAMIKILANFVNDLVKGLSSGSSLTFSIPYSFEGTLWVTVPFLAGRRVALKYGPLQSAWVLQP